MKIVLDGVAGVDGKSKEYRITAIPFGDITLKVHVYDGREDLEAHTKELTDLSNEIVQCKDERKKKLLMAAKTVLLTKVPQAFRFWWFDYRNKDVVVQGSIKVAEEGAFDRLTYGKRTEDINLKTGQLYKGIKDENVISRTRVTYEGPDERGFATFTCETGA